MFLKNRKNNYEMKSNYNVDDLYVANIEFISGDDTSYGPKVVTTEQRYIFEKLNEKKTTKYREIFTGFIVDSSAGYNYEQPYIINIVPLNEEIPNISNDLTKYGLLLIINEINSKKNINTFKKI